MLSSSPCLEAIGVSGGTTLSKIATKSITFPKTGGTRGSYDQSAFYNVFDFTPYVDEYRFLQVRITDGTLYGYYKNYGAAKISIQLYICYSGPTNVTTQLGSTTQTRIQSTTETSVSLPSTYTSEAFPVTQGFGSRYVQYCTISDSGVISNLRLFKYAAARMKVSSGDGSGYAWGRGTVNFALYGAK